MLTHLSCVQCLYQLMSALVVDGDTVQPSDMICSDMLDVKLVGILGCCSSALTCSDIYWAHMQ